VKWTLVFQLSSALTGVAALLPIATQIRWLHPSTIMTSMPNNLSVQQISLCHCELCAAVHVELDISRGPSRKQPVCVSFIKSDSIHASNRHR
jgi:hypothetical protein